MITTIDGYTTPAKIDRKHKKITCCNTDWEKKTQKDTTSFHSE